MSFEAGVSGGSGEVLDLVLGRGTILSESCGLATSALGLATSASALMLSISPSFLLSPHHPTLLAQ
jgi:hypothetical protein